MSWFGTKTNSASGEVAEAAVLEQSRPTVIKNLQSAIKELQVEYLNSQHITINTNDLSDRLLNVLEALFVHGLKDSFLGLPSKGLFSLSKHVGVVDGVASSASAQRQAERKTPKPAPNFWTFAMVFSHKDTLRRIDSLRQVNSDIGKSRAWIRLALNEGVLSSYLGAMSRDKITAKRHYKKGAILREFDCLDEISRLLTGIEVFQFDLALNSGLLNKWQPTPLIMAGLIAPNPLAANPVPVVALDVAMEPDIIDPLAANEADESLESLEALTRDSAPIGYLRKGFMNEEEALRMILKSSAAAKSRSASSSPRTSKNFDSAYKKSPLAQEQFKKSNKGPSPLTTSDSPSPPEDDLSKPETSHEIPTVGTPTSSEKSSGSSEVFETKTEEKKITKKRHPDDSSDDESEDENSIYSSNFNVAKSLEKHKPTFSPADLIFEEEEEEKTRPCDEVSTDSGEDNFTNIVSKAKAVSRTSSSSTASSTRPNPCLSGFIDSWNPFGNERYFDMPPESQEDGHQFGFTFQTDVSVPGLNVADSQKFLRIFDRITHDFGLDAQNFECAGCSRAIGAIFGKPKVCAYTKKYFCEECHGDEVATIPARVVFNWDFRQFKVCKKAKTFLRAMSVEPLVEYSAISNATLEYSKVLRDCLKLRKELMFMNAYLSTCLSKKKPNAKKQFDKILHQRCHLVEENAKFSIRDFEEMHSGKLKSVMNEAAKLAKSHIVKDCVLCSNRGFICELCRKGSPLYPFNLESIMQCQKCHVVFHLECSKNITSCPKCDRLEARHLNWQVSMSKAQRSENEIKICQEVS